MKGAVMPRVAHLVCLGHDGDGRIGTEEVGMLG